MSKSEELFDDWVERLRLKLQAASEVEQTTNKFYCKNRGNIFAGSVSKKCTEQCRFCKK